MIGAASGIGAGTQFIGSVLQMVAAKQAQEAMGRAFQHEQERQTAHQTDAFGSFNSFLPSQGVESAREAIKIGAGERMKQFANAGEQRFSTGKDAHSAQDKASYGLKSQARANLGGYTDWQLSSAIKRIRQSDKMNRIAYMAQQDASVFPYRMFDAQHSGDDLAAIGSLIAASGGNAASFSQFSQSPDGTSGGGGGVGDIGNGTGTSLMRGPAFGSTYRGYGGKMFRSTPNDQGGGYSAPIN